MKVLNIYEVKFFFCFWGYIFYKVFDYVMYFWNNKIFKSKKIKISI